MGMNTLVKINLTIAIPVTVGWHTIILGKELAISYLSMQTRLVELAEA
jgi:hypothetical protein